VSGIGANASAWDAIAEPLSGAEHTHAWNVPAAVQTWAPCWPVTHAQAMLAPGTHVAGAALASAEAPGGLAA